MHPDEIEATFHAHKRVRMNYASDLGVHGEGIIVGYSLVPMVYVLLDNGKRVWWRHDMTELVEDSDAFV